MSKPLNINGVIFLKQIKAGYELSAGEYHQVMDGFMFESAREMVAQLGNIEPGAAVLDVACGTGMGIFAVLEKCPSAKAAALDFSPAMLEAGKLEAKKLGFTGIEWVQGDACALPFTTGEFNRVISHNSLHLIPEWSKALAEMVRITKPGGMVAIRAFTALRIKEWCAVFEQVRQELLADAGVPAMDKWPVAAEYMAVVEKLPVKGYDVKAFYRPQRVPLDKLLDQTGVALGYWKTGLESELIKEVEEQIRQEMSKTLVKGLYPCTAAGIEIILRL